jgi:hypothetical protein
MLRCFMGWTVALLVGFAPPALAQEPTETSAAQSHDPAVLFQLGKDRYAEGKFDEAYAAYKKAYELQPAFDIAGNLGNVEVKLGKYPDAVVHLRYVLANLPPSYAPERREKVIARTKELLAEASQHVAFVVLAISPEGARVSIDGESIGTTPLQEEVVLSSGKHQIVADKEGYQTLTHEIDAAAGQKETLRMSLAPAGDPNPGTVQGDQAEDGDDGPIWPLVIVGGVVGLGALGAGIGLHVVASGKADDRETKAAGLPEDACTQAPPHPACAEIDELASEESTLSSAGTGLLIGGGVVLAATVVYTAVTLAGGSNGDSARVRWIPLAGPDLAGALVEGRF